MAKLTITDLEQWIDNDEGLYNLWRQSKLSKHRFIMEYRKMLEMEVGAVLTGAKQAHSLTYHHGPGCPCYHCKHKERT